MSLHVLGSIVGMSESENKARDFMKLPSVTVATFEDERGQQFELYRPTSGSTMIVRPLAQSNPGTSQSRGKLVEFLTDKHAGIPTWGWGLGGAGVLGVLGLVVRKVL